MTLRIVILIFVGFFLVTGVIQGQCMLNRIATNLAEEAETVCRSFEKEDLVGGREKLEALTGRYAECRQVLLIFLNDVRVYEIGRSLQRARRLAEAEDLSPAMEALSDFACALRELTETHLPNWENILKIHESFGIIS